MNNISGLEVLFGGKSHQLQCLSGSKVFYNDGVGNKIELKDIVTISIPTLTVDDILYVTITMPLLDIKFKGESQ